MTKFLSTLLSGVFFFTSLTCGQWTFFAQAHARDFNLDEDDDFASEPAPKKEAPKSSSGDKDIFGDDFDSDSSAKGDSEKEEDKKRDSLDSSSFDEEKPEAKTVTKTAGGKSIAAYYFFADTTAEEKGKDLLRSVGSYLDDLSGYSFTVAEAKLYNQGQDRYSADADKARRLLDEGAKLNADVEAEQAQTKLKSALDIAERHIEAMTDFSLVSDILFQLGASHKIMDNDAKAKEAFLRVLSLNPDYQPAEEADDDAKGLFEETKSGMMMQPVGDITVSSEPAGASFYLDGKLIGSTPAKADGVMIGKHYWRVHRNGYKDEGGIVRVDENIPASLDATLDRVESAADFAEWERTAGPRFGSAEMMKKAVEVGSSAGTERMILFFSSFEEDSLKVKVRLINTAKKSFKEDSVTISSASLKDISRSEDFRTMLDNLFADEYGFNPVSTIISGDLSTDGGKKEDSGSVVTSWWFWTIIGGLVAGAAAGTTAYFLTKDSGGSTGAKMNVNFGQ